MDPEGPPSLDASTSGSEAASESSGPKERETPRGSGLLRVALLVYVPVALASGAWICARHGSLALARRFAGPLPLRDVLLGTGVALMVVGASRLAAATWPAARRAERALAETIGPLSLTGCVLIATASGLGEEMLFRGVIQPALGLWPAALLFGAAHVPMRRELIAWPAFAVAMGLLLGWMADFTGALLAPIVAHVLVNAVNLRFIAPRQEARRPPIGLRA